jgi:transposase
VNGLAGSVDAVIGVDTHRDTLAAAIVTPIGAVLASTQAAADAHGYRALLDFAQAHAPGRRCWAVEGAGLAAFLAEHGEHIVEVCRPKRPPRAGARKSDAMMPSAPPAKP